MQSGATAGSHDQRHAGSTDPETTLADLEARLAATPRAARPLEHAALRYAVGMAYAERPGGDRQVNLSRAVASYDRALELYRPDRFPQQHSRVQVARGAALRELGQPGEAAAACEQAVALLHAEQQPADRAAALNNLGLARSDLGEHAAAVQALEEAVALFDAAGEMRHYVMALHNLGQAHAAADDHAAAVTAYESAIEATDPQDLPFQWAFFQHSLGVSHSALGDGHAAVEAFRACLRVFTRERHPFQHALAKNNLGLAYAQIGDVPALRRAVASYEDALQVFDTRVHRQLWQQAYHNLELAEQALASAGHDASRTEHFAALLADAPPTQRLSLLRERLQHLLSLPEPRRSEALGELDVAMLRLEEEGAVAVTAAWLDVLMEMPNPELVVALTARLAAHDHLEPEERERASRLLDRVITEELLAPQRIRVRDTLTALGWERP